LLRLAARNSAKVTVPIQPRNRNGYLYTLGAARKSDLTNAQSPGGTRLANQSPAGRIGAASRKRLDPHLEPIDFKLGEMVCDAGGLLKHAYFPQGSVLSLLTVLERCRD
jgi:hypothetical protein